MLNPILYNRIPNSTLIANYKNGVNEVGVADTIRNIRLQTRADGIDLLQYKRNLYGNSGEWGRSVSAILSKVIFNNNTVPSVDIGKWRSIEFELIFRSEFYMNGFIDFIRSKCWSKFVTVKKDVSIYSDYDDRYRAVPREVVVTYKSGQENMVREICSFLKGKAYSNNTCGTHVHFDMRDKRQEQVEAYGLKLERAVPALRLLLPTWRRDSEYCLKANSGIYGDRYAFVNLAAYRKYKTIEIRGHSGTIEAEKILNWIKICETIMNSRVHWQSKKITTIEKLCSVFDFDDELKKYIFERYIKYLNIPTTPNFRQRED